MHVEIIDLQNNKILNEKYNNVNFLFLLKYIDMEKYPNL